MTRKLSISTAWDEAKAVFARDGRLLVAVSLALVGIPVTIANFVAPAVRPGTVPEGGPWIIVLLLALGMIVAGLLAIVRLALGVQDSVGGAVRLGFVRLPGCIATGLLILFPLLVGAAVLNILLSSGNAAQAEQMALGVLVLLLIIAGPLLSRFLLTPPLVVGERASPLAQVRRSWRLTRGNGLRLFGVFLLLVIAIAVMEYAIGAVLGSVITLLLGAPEPRSVGKLLLALALGLLRSVEVIVVAVMLARLYLQAVAEPEAQASVPSSGT